jgi:hypothetical protein
MLLNKPVRQTYTYDTIDTSQYCGGKTPKVVASEDKCPSYNTLCCTIPDAYNYHSKYKRFVPTVETLNVACEPGLCMSVMDDGEYLQPANIYSDKKRISLKMNKKCYNDTHCGIDTNDYQQVCVDPTSSVQRIDGLYKTKYGWERKSVYEVERKHEKDTRWIKDPLYTNKNQHPYYIKQEKQRKAAEVEKQRKAKAKAKAKAIALEKKLAKQKTENYNLRHPVQTLMNSFISGALFR